MNISRALGPALGGADRSSRLGIAAPFWINAICNLAVIGALLWWRAAKRAGTLLPAERFGQRHARPACAMPGTTRICARR